MCLYQQDIKDMKLYKIANELLQTERAYVKRLHLLEQVSDASKVLFLETKKRFLRCYCLYTICVRRYFVVNSQRRHWRGRFLWRWWKASSQMWDPSTPSTASSSCLIWRHGWASGERSLVRHNTQTSFKMKGSCVAIKFILHPPAGTQHLVSGTSWHSSLLFWGCTPSMWRISTVLWICWNSGRNACHSLTLSFRTYRCVCVLL